MGIRNSEEIDVKQKIISAAQLLFVKKGYHETTIPDIVQVAGVSTGAIYHHFSNKIGLAKEIHCLAVSELFSRFNNSVNSKTTYKEKIYAYVDLMFKWTEDDSIMVNYLLCARPKEILNKSMSICSEEGLTLVKELIFKGMQSSEIKDGNIDVLYGIVSGTIARLIELRLDNLLDTPLTQLSEETAEYIWLSIRNM